MADVIHRSGDRWIFHCPACRCGHPFDGTWTFNGDMAKPTIRPSIRCESSDSRDVTYCHSFVTEGRIEFLSDSTHALAGKTVELPPWDGMAFPGDGRDGYTGPVEE